MKGKSLAGVRQDLAWLLLDKKMPRLASDHVLWATLHLAEAAKDLDGQEARPVRWMQDDRYDELMREGRARKISETLTRVVE